MLPDLSLVSVYFCSPQTINTKAASLELEDGTVRTRMQLATKTDKAEDNSTSNPKTSSVAQGSGVQLWTPTTRVGTEGLESNGML